MFWGPPRITIPWPVTTAALSVAPHLTGLRSEEGQAGTRTHRSGKDLLKATGPGTAADACTSGGPA